MKSIFFISILFCTTFFGTFPLDSNQEHDTNFRKFFCNNAYRELLAELPEHLIDACKKSGIDHRSIHVFKENSNPTYHAHTVGSNIMLTNGFWRLDKETQTWYFAHELSHVKHEDTKRLFSLRQHITDFHIGSSALALVNATRQVVIKKLQSLPAVAITAGVWGLSNIIALRLYYKNIQEFELRSNDEAARAVGVDASINFLKESRWLRDYSQNTSIGQRLNIYKDWLGFCEHGSRELQIRRLEQIKREQSINEAQNRSKSE